MKKTRIVCLLCALILLFNLVGCGSSKPKVDTANAVRVGTTSAPISMDMLTYGAGIAFQLTFEGLFDMNPVTGQVEP